MSPGPARSMREKNDPTPKFDKREMSSLLYSPHVGGDGDNSGPFRLQKPLVESKKTAQFELE